jgi:2-dehydro-3-deoxyglucarate aldolase/4-hydroxy-2-oxoheptanedioate aldolase
MPTPLLAEKLRADGGAAFGTMVFEFFTPGMPAIVAATGADFILYDMEHSGAGLETLKAQVAACRGLAVAPLARVPTTEYDFIARALDVGAHGVMLPMVETRAQAEFIAACAHYPPKGRRGAAFGVAHDDYRSGSPAEKIIAAEARTLVVAQIETPEGVRNVDAIAATPGVDILWLGHFDLTNFMGIPGQFEHPEYRRAVAAIVNAARRHGKAAGFMASDEQWAREYWEYGFRMLAYGLDHHLFQRALGDGIKALRRLRGGQEAAQ